MAGNPGWGGGQHWVQMLALPFSNLTPPGKVHSCTCFLNSLIGGWGPTSQAAVKGKVVLHKGTSTKYVPFLTKGAER